MRAGRAAAAHPAGQDLEGAAGGHGRPGGVSLVFDGDTFFVTFPRVALPQPGPIPRRRSAACSWNRRCARWGSSAWAAGSPEVGARQVPAGGNIDELLRAVCQPANGRENLSNQVCGLLQNRDQIERASEYVRRTLGQSVTSLRREVGRGLEFWFFAQYEGEVPIEHKAVVALRYQGQQVSSVFGAYLNNYAPTNRAALNGDAAVARGLGHLLQLEGLEAIPATPAPVPDAGAGPAPQRPEPPTLVLLPYGTVASDGGGAVTAVRYAYRAGVSAIRPLKSGGQRVGYTIWADAETGQVLKFDPDFNDATIQAQAWCRDPAKTSNGSDQLCPVEFPVDTEIGTAPRVLRNGPFAQLQVTGSPAYSLPGDSDQLLNAADAAYGVCTFPGNTSDFRQVSTFAHLNRGLTLVSAGGYFSDFPGKINVAIDSTAPSSAVLSTLQLTFNSGERTDLAGCPNILGSALNGAQDATIVSHELAHLATLNLQNVLQTGCRTRCPTTNKKNRQFFHDYSDGYSTMMTRSPCVGGWMAKNVSAFVVAGDPPPPDDQAQLAESCMNGFEAGGLPRLLVSDYDTDAFPPGRAFVGSPEGPSGFKQDAFPEHHNLNQGEYADGQIVGAAMWAMFQGVNSHSPLVGELALWGRVNRGCWPRASPRAPAATSATTPPSTAPPGSICFTWPTAGSPRRATRT